MMACSHLPMSRAVASQGSCQCRIAGPQRVPRTHRRVSCASLEKRFQEAMTMSQVYVSEADRPAPIPASEHEARRKRKQLEEIAEVAKRKGIAFDVVEKKLNDMDAVLPGLVNLHKAKASDWVAIISDTNELMSKIIVLKEVFPNANVLRLLSDQPRMLLIPTTDLKADAEKVQAMLSSVEGADVLVDQIPSFANPINLERALNDVRTLFPGQSPIEILMKNPTVLNTGDIEDSAEYGELSTKE